MPLLRRFQAGEGALFAVNAALIWHSRPGLGLGVLQTSLCLLVLAAMYQINDLWDARQDLKNPKKDKRLASLFLEHARQFYVAACAQMALLVLLAAAYLGASVAAAITAVFAVNILYSLRIKGIPVLDVLWVGAWGFAYAAIAQPATSLCLFIGLLTMICHVFQATIDCDVDRANGVMTSAAFSRSLATVLLFAACGALCFALKSLGIVVALSVFIPALLAVCLEGKRLAWLFSKAYMAALFLVVLTHAPH